MKVLIIHRQQSFLEGIKERFTSGNWQVQTSNNGLEGLLIARHRPFDLILCGFDLPVVSGTELIRSLRILSLNRSTPVFFLTEKSNAVQRDFAERLLADVINNTQLEGIHKIGWLQ